MYLVLWFQRVPMYLVVWFQRVPMYLVLWFQRAHVPRIVVSARAPMHLAAIEDSPNIARLLQKSGAQRSPRDINSATPLHLAAEYECLNMVKCLLQDV